VQRAASPTPTTGPDLDTPAGAAQAILGSRQFGTNTDRFGGDWHSVLDTPVLIHAYKTHTGIEYYDNDHWVASVRNGDGNRRGGLYDFVYLRAQHRLRFASFGVIGSDANPHAHQAFPYTSADAALAQLRAARGLGPKAGASPELIFFPLDPALSDFRTPAGQQWKGGGTDPLGPMWRITATDGVDYFVGTDLKVYTASQLPIDPNQK